MRATGTFRVETFTAADVAPVVEITTALPVGVAVMEKRYEGDVSGRSATVFTSAFDQASGVGTYVAMESFEGAVAGRRGAFNFVHAASTSGTDRADEYGLIVPGSGTDELTGIAGTVRLHIDDDGTHRMDFDHNLG